ncbi:MAG TPA: hypothetical protein VEC19_08700 [Usitatibacter sp.]|nr:hypothetical protein [Usitatibacter sp.]
MDITAIARKAREKAIEHVAAEEAGAQRGSGLVTPKQIRGRAEQEVDARLQLLMERMVSGFAALRSQYAALKGRPSHEATIDFLEEGFFDGKDAALAAHASEGDEAVDLREAWSISLEALSAAHDLAAALVDEGRFEEASNALFCLLNLAPDLPELCESLAHAEYHCGRLEDAVRCYCMAYACDPANPAPLVHAAYCSNKLGNKEDAREYLDLAEEANRQAGDEQVARDIQQLRGTL